MGITLVSATHVIHLYFYTCNTPKIPHMYYRCSTTGHVVNTFTIMWSWIVVLWLQVVE